MPVEKLNDGKVACVFGTGDILIASGKDVGTEELQITLSQCDSCSPIDVKFPEMAGTVIENWSVKLYFDKPESVDSFIHVLQDFKKERFPNNVDIKDDIRHKVDEEIKYMNWKHCEYNDIFSFNANISKNNFFKELSENITDALNK